MNSISRVFGNVSCPALNKSRSRTVRPQRYEASFNLAGVGGLSDSQRGTVEARSPVLGDELLSERFQGGADFETPPDTGLLLFKGMWFLFV